MRECTRCSAKEQEDALGAALTHYVCTYCRKDGLIEFGYTREVEDNADNVLAEITKDLTDVDSN